MFWEDDFVHEMRRVHDEMNRLFNNFMKVENRAFGGKEKYYLPGKKGDVPDVRYRSPQTHMCETENSLLVSFELPGIDKKDIDLKVRSNQLILDVMNKKVEKKSSDEVKGTEEKRPVPEKGNEDKDSWLMKQEQHFYKSIPLPVRVDPKKAKASYQDGMLRIEMPKTNQIDTDISIE